jgi:hypothetical protein
MPTPRLTPKIGVARQSPPRTLRIGGGRIGWSRRRALVDEAALRQIEVESIDVNPAAIEQHNQRPPLGSQSGKPTALCALA